jgi:adenosylmethionine-8-amino-7-oxononanoate aminotransferase
MDSEALGRMDRAHLWHPWTPVGQNDTDRLLIVSGAGCEVVDVHGRRYLDAKAGALNASVGYAHPRVVEAIAEQAAVLMAYDLSGSSTAPAIELAARVAGLAGGGLTRTFFCGSGTEATEAAVKMVRMYHALRGEPGRRWVISLADGYHGASLGALSLTGLEVPRKGNDPLPQRFATIDTPRCRACLLRSAHTECKVPGPQALADAIQWLGVGRVAAFVMEPILGVGGVIVPPTGYLKAVRDICDQSGALLVLDEVMTGFGRTGRWFAHQHAEVVPDLVTSGKGLSGGYVPLAAVTATDAVYDAFAGDELLGGFRHGHTTSGHAVACAAALAVIDVIESGALVCNAAVLGERLLAGLDELRGLPCVRDVRGQGLLIGVEMDTPQQAVALTRAARVRGVIVRQQRAVITVGPPLILTAEEGDRIVDALLAGAASLETGGGR